jgi:hypothetical protein
MWSTYCDIDSLVCRIPWKIKFKKKFILKWSSEKNKKRSIRASRWFFVVVLIWKTSRRGRQKGKGKLRDQFFLFVGDALKRYKIHLMKKKIIFAWYYVFFKKQKTKYLNQPSGFPTSDSSFFSLSGVTNRIASVDRWREKERQKNISNPFPNIYYSI